MTDGIFPKRLERPEVSPPVTDATNDGLKALAQLMVKCSCQAD